MIRNRKRAPARPAGMDKRSREARANRRLAAMSARIDSARATSFARRPVFNRSLDVVAYEVVLGDGPITRFESVDDRDDGARRLVVNGSVDLDLAAVSAGKPAHLTLAASAFDSVLPTGLDPTQIAVVLAATVQPSAAAMAALGELRERRIRIVLDDPSADSQRPALLRLADAAKINVGRAAGSALAAQATVLREAGVKLVADGVGSYEELRAAIKLGFTEFQGSFLSRPDGFRRTRAPAGQLATLELITLLQDPDADISDIADVIRRDVSLSYRILKVVNSARYALSRPLGSIEEAVVLVGTRQIISWVGMLGMAGLNNKPSELARLAMVRARVCETLAASLDRPDGSRFYTVGLFSVIEALLDVPAPRALAGLPLEGEIVDAIAAHNGIMGEVLHGVIAYEEGDWAGAHILGIEDKAMGEAFLAAMIETDELWERIAD
jgi:EAL and modified HD-GYP domain-containing signal transduction protein